VRLALFAGVIAALLAFQGLAEEPAASAIDAHYSAASLYNLANAYARAGKPGLAVLNYQRAALVSPDDSDIEANLKSVRTSAHVPVTARSRLERVAHYVGPTVVASAGVLGVLIAGFGILIGIMLPRRRWLSMIASTIGFAAIAFTACNAAFWAPKLNEAVVIVSTTAMRATPVPMGDPLQPLSEAETLAVQSIHEDFALVRASSGREGWVARADIAEVVPRTSTL
jgi:hypothetical protein